MTVSSCLTIGKRIAGWVCRAELVFLLLLAPLLLFPSPQRSLAMLGVPLLWACHWLARGHPVRRTPLDWSLLLLLVMVLVSLYATFDVAFSLPKLAGIVLGVGVFYGVVDAIHSKRDLAYGVVVFILAGIGLAGVGLLGTNWIYKLSVLESVVSRLPQVIRGLPGAEVGFQPNAVGGSLLWFIPLQVSLLVAAWRTVKGGHWPDVPTGKTLTLSMLSLSLVTTGGVLFLTQSRGAWFGLAVALLVLLAWSTRWGRWLATGVLAAGIVLAVVYGPATVGDAVMGSIGGTADLGGKLAGRMELWSRALYAIADFPFTGPGLNTFRRVVHVLYPLFLESPDVDIAHAHNHLLQAALDLGLPGLVAYGALWMGAGFLVVDAWRRTAGPWAKAVAQGLAGGLLAGFVFGMTDVIPLGSKVGLFFWTILALAVALYNHVAVPQMGGTDEDD